MLECASQGKKGERLRVLEEEEEEGDERRSFSALSPLLDPSSVCFRTKVRLSPALASIILPRGEGGGKSLRIGSGQILRS